ncbi:MAG: chaperonin GroEL [Polyangiales bacterium]|jgi:chaperonin GroEL
MTAKSIIYDISARRRILDGVDKLGNAVRVTLGPRGRNVVLSQPWGAPKITKDGVTVAKSIELADRFENMGAQMVREVASKTADVAGDGTTTATVLAQSIYREGARMVAAGYGPMGIKRGIEQAVERAVDALNTMSKPLAGPEEILQVATISSNGDVVVGKILAEAFAKVGTEGVITVEENQAMEMELEVVEGMQFDRGYLSSYFVTNAESLECELEETYVLFYEKRISNLRDMLPLLEAVAAAGKPLLIIAEDVEGEALSTLVVNKLRGALRCAAVKAPGYGASRKEMLEDMAILTGGKVISEDLGIKLEKVTLEDLGRARLVRIDKETTTLIEGAGDKTAIKGRVDSIQRQIDDAKSDYDREKLAERLAKLSGGVAIVKVGAPTETEMKERQERVDDALHATRAALQEGIVVGGGVALVRMQKSLDSLKLDEEEERIGVSIVRRALEEPLRMIAANAGLDGAIVVGHVRDGSGAFGFNAATAEYGDLLEWGVVDPTKVVRCALQNAASVAALLLTTAAMIAIEA